MKSLAEGSGVAERNEGSAPEVSKRFAEETLEPERESERERRAELHMFTLCPSGHVQLTYFCSWSDVEESCDKDAIANMYCAPGETFNVYKHAKLGRFDPKKQ